MDIRKTTSLLVNKKRIAVVWRIENLQSIKFFRIVSFVLCSFFVFVTLAQGQSGQDLQEESTHPVPHDAVYFTTDIDDDSPLVLFNLISFTSSSDSWSGAGVEVKFPIDKLDQPFIKRLSNTTDFDMSGQFSSFLPPIDYQVAGKLMARNELVKPLWIVWVPNVTTGLSSEQQKSLTQLINALRNEADPEGQVAIFYGDLLPRLKHEATRVADLKLKPISKTRRQSVEASPLNFTTDGLGELLAAVKLQQDQIDLKDRPPQVRYSCGRSCKDLIPSARIVILHEGEITLPSSMPQNYSSLFQSLSYPNHFLYQSDFYFVDITSNVPPIYPKISWFPRSTTSADSDQLNGGNLDSFSLHIENSRRLARTTYYSIQPLVIPQYYWTKESLKLSTRIASGEQSFVQRAQLYFPFDDRQKKRERRQSIYEKYRSKLDLLRGEVMTPQPLSFMTRLVIGVLWAGLCLAVIFIMIVRLRRHRSSTSESALKIDKISTSSHFPTSTQGNSTPIIGNSSSASDPSIPERESHGPSLSSDGLLPDWTQPRDPAEHERSKRQKREQSIKIHKPSQASPMVNPEDPSTVPAPAAVAKVSNQPAEADQDLSSAGPQPQGEIQDLPVERLDIISEVLSLDSAPPLNENQPTTPSLTSEDTARAPLSPIAGLYAERGPMRKYIFLLSELTATVGRSPYNSCPLPPDGERSDRQISREHFELSRIHEERWEIRCKSSQGLHLNKTLINQGESAIIEDQDLIIIGDTYLRFRSSTVWQTSLVKEQLKLIHTRAHHTS